MNPLSPVSLSPFLRAVSKFSVLSSAHFVWSSRSSWFFSLQFPGLWVKPLALVLSPDSMLEIADGLVCSSLFVWNPFPDSMLGTAGGSCSPPFGISLQPPFLEFCWLNPYPGPRFHRGNCRWCMHSLLCNNIKTPALDPISRSTSIVSFCWSLLVQFFPQPPVCWVLLVCNVQIR